MTSRLKRGACYASASEGYAYYGRRGLAHKTAFKSLLVGGLELENGSRNSIQIEIGRGVPSQVGCLTQGLLPLLWCIGSSE